MVDQKRVYTAGYQGISIEDFISRMVQNGIEVVIDVRRRPMSRKPGFAKTRFSSALQIVGVDYQHEPKLGMMEDRLKERNLKDNSQLLMAYIDYLDSNPKYIEELIAIACTRRACLVCYESDPKLCHRQVLATYLAQEADFEIVSL